MIKSFSFLCVTITCVWFLSSCGIKPAQVSAPDGTDETVFPQEYPKRKD